MPTEWHGIDWGNNQQNLGYTIDRALNELLDNCHNYFTHGSGMIFKSMVSLDINISGVKQKQTSMSYNYKEHTYGHRNIIDTYHINKIARKAVIDVRELSDYCFIFSLAASLTHTKYESLQEKENPKNYHNFICDNFNLGDIKFPIKHTDIQKFVDINPQLNISIHVHTLINDEIDTVLKGVKHSDNSGEISVDLLALFPKTTDATLKPAHFVCVRNMSSLMSYRDDSGKKQYRHVCDKCKMQFSSDSSEKYLNHKEYCTNHFNQFQQLPTSEDRIEFKNWNAQYLEEICIFYDLESMLTPTEGEKMHCNECLGICKCITDGTKKSFTVTKQNHNPNVYSYCVVDKNGKILEQESKVCFQNRAHVKLLKRLLEIQKKYTNMAVGEFKETPRISMTERMKMLRDQENKCNHCFQEFDSDNPPVLDHCHYSNEINALLHQQCNLSRQRKKRIPCIAHNAMRYDSHFIVQAMTELKDEIKFFHVLPLNQENYRAIKIDDLWFIDSFEFMKGSLDSLVQQEVSVTKVEDLNIINQARRIKNPDGSINEKKRNFYLKKGLVPWSLVWRWKELMKKRKNLPLEEKHYWSDLNEAYPPQEDIERAGDFYTTFGCDDLISFIIEYCEMDVVQLAQVFMNFRKKVWDFARIDVLKFVGLPSAAYEIFKKKSKCSIGMIEDESKSFFVFLLLSVYSKMSFFITLIFCQIQVCCLS